MSIAIQEGWAGRLAVASAIGLASLGGAAQAAVVVLPDTVLTNSPGAYTANGYYTNDLGNTVVMTGGGNASNVGGANGRNDDGFSLLNLGFDITYFGNTYNSLYINNNGNVSFGSGISAYVPTGPTGAAAPVISPFFGDVDTRTSAGVVKLNTAVANQIVVTWDAVGRFSNKATPTNNFQLVLRGGNYSVPNGEGSIGFFYGMMDWLQTDTSQVAAVGFGDGAGAGEVLASSLQPGLNDLLENKYVWFDANLVVVPPPPPPNGVPEPGSYLLALLALAGCGLATQRKRKPQA